MMRTFLVAALTGLIVLGLAAPAAAATHIDDETRVVLTGGLTLDQDERASDVVVFNGPVVIDGTVTGSVVVFNGTVTVTGHIDQNLVVFNGDVRLEGGASVGKDVATGRTPTIAPGATVGGHVRRVRTRFSFGFVGRFVVWLAYSISTLILGFLLIMLAPRGLDAVARAARERIGAAIGVGFFIFLGIPILAILLLVTLVGIPLGLAILLALFLLYTVGYTASAWLLGRLVMRDSARRPLPFFIGWLILRGAGLVPILGGIVWFLASVFGLGALVVATWQARTGPAKVPPMPIPPNPVPAPPA
jgi:cytoskeletal protein CcmA (bactofilin family)